MLGTFLFMTLSNISGFCAQVLLGEKILFSISDSDKHNKTVNIIIAEVVHSFREWPTQM